MPAAPFIAPAGARPPGIYATVLKRACDLVAATLLLMLLAPVMAAVALAVRLVLGRPVFHRDLRSGRDGKPFEVVKFRSMAERVDAAGRLLPDEKRLGLFGRCLRATSVDELPQLVSVVRGEMSLVGPRPLPLRYVPRYSTRQATRLLVRPGLTGWAQIHGRNALEWGPRLEYDARYVEILGRWYAPLADCWIIVVTLFQLIVQAVTGRGVAAPGSATMQEFQP
jgi:lipopolysaccharide/colanic/teichoic acid biosynthesis glycosyltransferase